MRSALPALLISVALLTGGCSGPSYLRSLELRRSVCDLSYPGVICAQPGSGSGGIGSLAGGFGGSGGTSDLTLSTSEIFDLGTNGGQSFDLVAFSLDLLPRSSATSNTPATRSPTLRQIQASRFNTPHPASTDASRSGRVSSTSGWSLISALAKRRRGDPSQ